MPKRKKRLPSTDQLREIAILANRFKELEEDIAKQTAETAKLSKEYNELCQKTIPDTMRDIGIKSFEMAEGGILNVEEKMSASLTGKYLTPAIKMLHDLGLTSLITHDVTVKFDKGEEGRVKKLLALVQKHVDNPNVAAKENINTNSFKATCRELKEEGKVTKDDLKEVGVTVYYETKLT